MKKLLFPNVEAENTRGTECFLCHLAAARYQTKCLQFSCITCTIGLSIICLSISGLDMSWCNKKKDFWNRYQSGYSMIKRKQSPWFTDVNTQTVLRNAIIIITIILIIIIIIIIIVFNEGAQLTTAVFSGALINHFIKYLIWKLCYNKGKVSCKKPLF